MPALRSSTRFAFATAVVAAVSDSQAVAFDAACLAGSLNGGCTAAAGGEDETASLLQNLRAHTAGVQCPGSSAYCSGNQCCPGTSATGDKTFPCPNAADGWNSCQGPPPSTVEEEPITTVVDACGCDCQWLASGEDACDKDLCADRCRVANGITGPLHCSNGEVWQANRNLSPQNVHEGSSEVCNCQWMAQDGGLGDDCKSGCSTDNCAYKCREANPQGTCLAQTAPVPTPAPTPATPTSTEIFGIIQEEHSGLVLELEGSPPSGPVVYQPHDRYSLQFAMIKDIRQGAQDNEYVFKSSNGLCFGTSEQVAEGVGLNLSPWGRYCMSFTINTETATTKLERSGFCVSFDPSAQSAPGTMATFQSCDGDTGLRFKVPEASP